MSKNYSDMADKTHVALITETWRESVARDLSTAATFLVLWSIGYYAESPALEWVGVLLGFVFLVGNAVKVFRGILDKRMTPKEAREWLDHNFPEQDQ